MALNLVVLLVVLGLAILLAWVMFRAAKIRRMWIRIVGVAGLAVPTLLIALIGALIGLGAYQAYAPRGNDVLDLQVEVTPEKVERGEKIAAAMCAACHTLEGDLPLTGAGNLFDEVPLPLGSATPPNLTPEGRIDEWTDGELIRVIREGTYPNGHLMPVMSSQTFRVFSRDDLESIVAYLRTQPPAPSSQEPQQWLSPLALLMLPLGMLPVKEVPSPEIPAAVAVGPTAEYGEYIAGFVDCVICHGDDYKGGTSPVAPVGPALSHVSGWTVDQFMTTFRTGVTPDGRTLGEEMPWKYFGRMDDTEIIALYEFIKTVG